MKMASKAVWQTSQPGRSQLNIRSEALTKRTSIHIPAVAKCISSRKKGKLGPGRRTGDDQRRPPKLRKHSSSVHASEESRGHSRVRLRSTAARSAVSQSTCWFVSVTREREPQARVSGRSGQAHTTPAEPPWTPRCRQSRPVR